MVGFGGDRGQKTRAENEAGLASLLFWGSLAFALTVAFVVAFPINWYLISRGKGHAVVPVHHRAHHERDEDRDS